MCRRSDIPVPKIKFIQFPISYIILQTQNIPQVSVIKSISVFFVYRVYVSHLKTVEVDFQFRSMHVGLSQEYTWLTKVASLMVITKLTLKNTTQSLFMEKNNSQSGH